MESEDPMPVDNPDPKPQAKRGVNKTFLRYLFLGFGIVFCLVIMLCPSYNFTEVHDDTEVPCTMYTFIRSFPPPSLFLGHHLADEYWLKVVFAVFLTALTFWRSRRLLFPQPNEDKKNTNKPDYAGTELNWLSFLWVCLFVGTSFFGLTILTAPQHQTISCTNPDTVGNSDDGGPM